MALLHGAHELENQPHFLVRGEACGQLYQFFVQVEADVLAEDNHVFVFAGEGQLKWRFFRVEHGVGVFVLAVKQIVVLLHLAL